MEVVRLGDKSGTGEGESEKIKVIESDSRVTMTIIRDREDFFRSPEPFFMFWGLLLWIMAAVLSPRRGNGHENENCHAQYFFFGMFTYYF